MSDNDFLEFTEWLKGVSMEQDDAVSEGASSSISTEVAEPSPAHECGAGRDATGPPQKLQVFEEGPGRLAPCAVCGSDATCVEAAYKAYLGLSEVAPNPDIPISIA